MPGMKVFSRKTARFERYRAAGRGYQDICEWVGEGTAYQAGIAELSHILIAGYRFGFDDFLYVLEGAVTLDDGGGAVRLVPGDAVHIAKDTVMRIEVPDRLVWIYAARAGSGHWSENPNQPDVIREYPGDPRGE